MDELERADSEFVSFGSGDGGEKGDALRRYDTSPLV